MYVIPPSLFPHYRRPTSFRKSSERLQEALRSQSFSPSLDYPCSFRPTMAAVEETQSAHVMPKDLEGVSDPVSGHEGSSTDEQPAAAEAASTGAKRKTTRQKRIAVLTSGGDSAGMNAAGESPVSIVYGWYK